MKVSKVQEILKGDVLAGEEFLNEDIKYCYGCDLMSDVLAFVKHNVILLTGLVHPQVLRTAEMLDIQAIVFVRGKIPSEDLIELAREKDLIIISTKHSLYTSCGLLYKEGMLGEEIAHETTL